MSDPKKGDIRVSKCTKKCIKICTKSKKCSKSKHERRREICWNLKVSLGGCCVDCLTKDLEVLEFDHIDPSKKLYRVADAPSFKTMIEEAAKCELRCRNCHQKRTTDQRRYSTSLSQTPNAIKQRKKFDVARDYVNSIKILIGGCEECGWFDINYLSVLEFDHIDASTKHLSVSQMVRRYNSIHALQMEIEKCRLLCGNCHIKRTNKQFKNPCAELARKLISNLKDALDECNNKNESSERKP